MVETKDPTLTEYENLIEELMQENDVLKKRISELEEENNLLKLTEYSFKEPTPPTVEKEEKKSGKSFKRSKIREKFESMAKKEKTLKPKVAKKEISVVESTTPSEETVTDLTNPTDPAVPALTKHEIVQGTSRRECPICGNTFKAFIQEIIDKTNIIMAYPRVYGKKLKCGKCGGEWRLPSTLE